MLPLAIGALVLLVLASSSSSGTHTNPTFTGSWWDEPRIDPVARYRVVSAFTANDPQQAKNFPFSVAGKAPRIVGVGETIRTNNQLISQGRFFGMRAQIVPSTPILIYPFDGVDPTVLAASIEFLGL